MSRCSLLDVGDEYVFFHHYQSYQSWVMTCYGTGTDRLNTLFETLNSNPALCIWKRHFWQQNHKELCSSAGLSVLIARHALPNKTMQNNEAKSYWLSVIVFNVLPLLQPGSTGSGMIPQKRSKQLPVSKGHSHRCYPTMFLTDPVAISRILMFNTWT